jgi:aminoglycoside phosphotransferase (APT) family kinase protein
MDIAARERALGAFVSSCVGQPATVRDLVPIVSVGNAREPWSFTATWADHEVRAVLLLKAAAGQVEADLGPEFTTIDRLRGSGVPVPGALWLDEEGAVLGRPFFVTEHVSGTASTRVLRRLEDRATVAALARQLAAAAARLHAVEPAPFTHLPATTPASTAIEQLGRWEDQFRRRRLEPHPELVYLITWLRQRPPPARRIAVVHGDLRFGNLLYDGDRLTALLDWEMVHLGDPVEDLGWVYRSLWTPALALPFDQFLAAYAAAGGEVPDREHLRWYQVLAEVKHATISLTAGRAFADRATPWLRHADRAATVPAFVAHALTLVEASC